LVVEKFFTFAEALKIPVQEFLPETISITNNPLIQGNGGGIVFGNQYDYGADSSANNALAKENENLKDEMKS